LRKVVNDLSELLLTAKLARTVGVKSRLILYKIGSVLMIVAGVFLSEKMLAIWQAVFVK
jgi:hypothetical protein